jgi:hypothetical protein
LLLYFFSFGFALFVFICVHLCSFMFIYVHLCSFMFIYIHLFLLSNKAKMIEESE